MTVRRLAAPLLIWALALGGCGAPNTPASPTTSPASAHSSASPTADPTTADPTESADIVGAVVIDALGDQDGTGATIAQATGVDVSGEPGTGATLITELHAGQSVAMTVSGPEGMVAAPQLDGSVAVVSNETLVLGLSAPTVSPDVEGITWQESAPDNADSELTFLLTAPPASEPAGAITVTVVVGQSAALSATWGHNEGGQSLAVEPSAWGRAGGLTVMEYGWQSVVALDPDAKSTSMEHQFQCHALGAPNKEFWNLEPWRDDIGLLKFISTRCNP